FLDSVKAAASARARSSRRSTPSSSPCSGVVSRPIGRRRAASGGRVVREGVTRERGNRPAVLPRWRRGVRGSDQDDLAHGSRIDAKGFAAWHRATSWGARTARHLLLWVQVGERRAGQRVVLVDQAGPTTGAAVAGGSGPGAVN